MKKLAVIAMGLLLAACSSGPALNTTFNGPVAMAPVKGEPVRLTLDMSDNKGQPYQNDTRVRSQYQQIAESALQQSGYTLSPTAATEIRVTLQGRTDKGIVDSHASTARNVALGAATMGIACSEMVHDVHAAGRILVIRDGVLVSDTKQDMRAQADSCFSKWNPSWLKSHMEEAAKLYEKAVTEHVAGWLPQVATR